MSTTPELPSLDASASHEPHQTSHDEVAQATSNPVFTGPILKTFFYYLVPSIIGLIAITTANLVDGAVVGNVIGPDALAAISLLIPYFTLLFGIALMLAIGGSVSAGKYIGEDNPQAASSVFSKSLIVTGLIALSFAILSTFGSHTLFSLLGAPENLFNTMQSYFEVITWILILQLVTMVLYYFVRADGHPVLATTALVIGATTNIILDIVFVAYLEWGIAGAAYATGISQVLQLTALSLYFRSKERTLSFSFIQHNWREILTSAYNGVSEFINEISAGIIIFLLNWLIISRLEVDGVAAFSVVNYLIFLSLMLAYGVADALHLLVSQNYGAQNFSRIRHFLFTAFASVLTIGLLLVTTLLLAGDTIIQGFLDADQKHISSLSEQLILLIWPLFLVNGINIILSCYLTAIHKPNPSALIAASRTLILPALLLLSFYWLFPGWLFLTALPIAEWLAFLLALTLCYQYRPQVQANEQS